MSPPSSGDVSPPTPQQQQQQQAQSLHQPIFDTKSPPSSTGSGFAGVLKNLARGGSRPTTQSGSSASASNNATLSTPVNLLLARTLSKAGGRRSPPSSSSGTAIAPILDVDVVQQYEQLRPGQPLPQRIAAAEALRHTVEDFALKDIMGIWAAAKSLIDTKLAVEARHAGFELLIACVKHAHPTPLERRQFFETLSAPCNPEDFHLQLEAMVELTDNGKDINAFEGVMMPMITRWLTDWFKASAAARKKEKENKGSRTAGAQGEETNLNQLYSFIGDVIRFSFNSFQETEINALLDQVLTICKRTTSSTDINNSVSIIRTLITYGDIPRAQLEPCLEVLCGSFITVSESADPAWMAISDLCKSHVAQVAVVSLLTIIRAPAMQPDRNTNTVRGAIAVLDRIVKANGAEGLPVVRVSLLMSAYQKSLAANSAKLECDVVEAVEGMLGDPAMEKVLLHEDDWSMLLCILAQCSKRTRPALDDNDAASTTTTPPPSISKANRERDLITRLANTLVQIIVHLERLCKDVNPVQREDIMRFFMEMHDHLPDSTASRLIGYYVDEHRCFPSDAEWLQHVYDLTDHFFHDATRSTAVRAQVLAIVRNVYQTITDIFEEAAITDFLKPILKSLVEERDEAVLEDLVALAVEVARHADPERFDLIIECLHERCLSEASEVMIASPRSTSSASVSRPTSSALTSHIQSILATAAVKGFVRIFLQSLDVSAAKAVKAFDALLEIAQSGRCETEARLCAMKLLFRLRSDGAYAIMVIQDTESDRVAAAINRTAGSAPRRPTADDSHTNRNSRADEPPSARSSRGTSMIQSQPSMSRSSTRTPSGTFRVMRPATPLWWYPDAEALPEPPPPTASRVLYSCADGPGETSPEMAPGEKMVIRINVWIEILIAILQQGGDWEIYSFVLVHLGSQLTNHTLFAGALPQIKVLRNVLCEQLKGSSFHDPPGSSGLKKADVTICLFHTLTMLLGFQQHMSKNEQDEMVRTFILGVGSWEGTATGCIHALATCCHELPLSISKSLNTILQKMSQIITQSHVAVHILEFLAGLARMPEVYVNLREDEHRKVFGICFRYLQYVRDQRMPGSGAQSVRTSYASGRQSAIARDTPTPEQGAAAAAAAANTTSEDLPPYVYALAYHVISFWFMCLKLPDRVKHVSWIIKNLVSTDASGRETIDEQSLVTIDLLQRVTYSDFDETAPDPDFASAADGSVSTKSWVLGSSILTIETAVGSGVSQVTKRQPSATTHSIYKSAIPSRPAHQIPLPYSGSADRPHEALHVAVLPNHMLLQLISSSSRTPESSRPIPLPDDEATGRALRALDRNSTVDNHKVGVIYIGEGQTAERDILANVMGSTDYTDFLDGLGTLVRLKGATFNTAGLDREFDTDGEFAFCWRDRVTEMVFHVTTMMPTNTEHDPSCTAKKRHTGNDFVNIIFNNSGLPFRFDTFPSEFNYVNIVITPESRTTFVARGMDSYQVGKQFYKVQVMSRPGFPEISPAAETKMISSSSLPAFVRLLALNASVFSLVWVNREGGEFVSSWRNRLREIVRLREKHAGSTSNSSSTTPTIPSSSSGAGGSEAGGGGMTGQLLSSRETSSAQRESLTMRRGSAALFNDSALGHRTIPSLTNTVASTEGTEWGDGSLVDGYDFSKWA